MNTQINKFRNYAKKTGKEASYWAYAAWTAPFVALTVIIAEELFGFHDWHGATIMIVIVTFIATSVFWWWWAITKIVYMIECANKVDSNILDITQEIKKIKSEITQEIKKINRSVK